jgi:hypothetical protein
VIVSSEWPGTAGRLIPGGRGACRPSYLGFLKVCHVCLLPEECVVDPDDNFRIVSLSTV